MTPFLFENWFRYRLHELHFSKMLNFRQIFPLVAFSLPIGNCQNVLR